MPHRLAAKVRERFNLAKQFGEFTYPDYDIAFERFKLVNNHNYVISPSHLEYKLFEHEEFLRESQRLTKEITGPIYIEFDPHLNPTAHAEYPTANVKKLEKELE